MVENKDLPSLQPVIYDQGDTLYAIQTYMPKANREIAIGKLGSFSFEKGTYVYVGSAKKNIQSRIARHLRIDKKFRWHFDYLRPYLKIEKFQTYPGEEGECQLFRRLMKENNGSVPVHGFGSSDCKCASHLFYIPHIEISRNNKK
ncbi:Uri superfamily endonuclease [Mesobacillus persicus]|uniref:Uri superfamily endonuclease n=1 Tax=Mesobacillus persicus TaxID=930146 RepID=A0A1H7WMP0_9BACI|nr:GIY-YIG nuclease family protein [Mesobacillus persicus]SEM22793.1 Uri superfamily endonuclease [Mesobacillus persicus]